MENLLYIGTNPQVHEDHGDDSDDKDEVDAHLHDDPVDNTTMTDGHGCKLRFKG